MIETAFVVNTQLGARRTTLSRQGPDTNIEREMPVTDLKAKDDAGRPSLREAFDDFVGQSFYGQLIGSMRKTVGKPAYFHGGRAEEVFQSQMDQQLAQQMSEATADTFTGPMFELFNLPRN